MPRTHKGHKRVSSLNLPQALKTIPSNNSLKESDARSSSSLIFAGENSNDNNNEQRSSSQQQQQHQHHQLQSSLKKVSLQKYAPSSSFTLPHENNNNVKILSKSSKGNNKPPKPRHKRVSSLKEEYGSRRRKNDFHHNIAPPASAPPNKTKIMAPPASSLNPEQTPLFPAIGGGFDGESFSPSSKNKYYNSTDDMNGHDINDHYQQQQQRPATSILFPPYPSEYNYNNPSSSIMDLEDGGVEVFPASSSNKPRKGSALSELLDVDDHYYNGGSSHMSRSKNTYESSSVYNDYDNYSTMSYLTSGRPLFKRKNNNTKNNNNDNNNSNNNNNNNTIKSTNILESFDYDPFESRVDQQFQLEQTESKIRNVDFGRWIMTFFIGVMTALIACFIERGCDKLCSLRSFAIRKAIASYQSGHPLVFGSPFAVYAGISCGFILIASYCAAIVCPVSAGSGIPEIKATLNGIKIHRVVRLQTLFCKVFGVLFSVSGGLPVGKEGPMVHSGAILGSVLSQGQWGSASGFAISCAQLKDFRNDKEKRDFISCGAAAGVAAAFGAPIGGVLFVLEEGASFWHQHLTWQTYFGAMVSAFTLHMVATFSGNKSSGQWGIMGTQGGSFSFGTFEGSSKHFAAWEVLLFIAMGGIGGLFGALFNGANTKLTKFRMKYITNKWLKLYEALFVAFCMAAVSFWLPYYFGSCFPKSGPFHKELVQLYCNPGEYNDLASLYTVYYGTSIRQLLHFTDGPVVSFTPLSLVMFLIPFYIMACWTYGISVPSGLFVPSLLSGAAFGRLCVYFIHWLEIPTIAPDGMFALIGAAAMLGGMARMTISLTVILLECTGVIEWGLPIMVTLMAARWVGNVFNEGLYDIHIHLKNLPFLHADTPFYSRYLRVENIMSSNPISINHITRVGEVYRLLKNSEHSCFPVLEEQVEEDDRFGSSKFVGVILRKHLCVLLQKKDFMADRPLPYLRKPAEGDTTLLHNGLYALNYRDLESSYPRYPQINEIKLSYEERQLWMDLTPYMNATPLAVNQQTPVTRVYRLFRSLGLRHLMVVNHSNELRGIVSRKDLTTQHLEDCLRHLSEADKIRIQGYTTFFKNERVNDMLSSASSSVVTESDSSSKERERLINDNVDNLSQQLPLLLHDRPHAQAQSQVSPTHAFQDPQLQPGYYAPRERSGTACSELTEMASFNETYENL